MNRLSMGGKIREGAKGEREVKAEKANLRSNCRVSSLNSFLPFSRPSIYRLEWSNSLSVETRRDYTVNEFISNRYFVRKERALFDE